MRQNAILFFVLLFTVKLSAQTVNIPNQPFDLSKINFDNVKFGVKISPNISWLSINHDDLQTDGATLKYGLGVVAQYEVNPILSIVTGINYNALGGYVFDSLSLNTITNKDNFRLNYSLVEVPLGLKVKTPLINRTCYYFQGGVSTGFIITANENHASTLQNTEIPPMDILSLTSPSIVGCYFGIGTSYKIFRSFELFGEINYKTSLTNLANAEEYAKDNIHKYKNPVEIYPASMEFSIGIMF